MMAEFWVFGYGSLMWRPGFAFEAQARARLHGHHRRLCVYSWVHRGTQARPGLVLGLDRGGSCIGTAYAVAEKDRDAVMAYLRAREQPTAVYVEVARPVRLEDGSGRTVEALCYVADRAHAQYAGALPVERLAEIVLRGVGASGANPEYVANTVAHLDEAGIADPVLRAVHARVQEALAGREREPRARLAGLRA
jgi:cation transport protein ChaC